MSKQSTREHLIQVGVGIVRSGGYSATGVNQVLEEAKVPKGSFYHHFTTKDEFILEVIKRYAAGEQERWEKLLIHSNLSPMKKLRRYFKDLIATYGVRGGPIAGCLLGNMSLEVAAHNAEIRKTLIQAFEAWESAIARTLQEGIDSRELHTIAKPKDLAALLVDGWEGAQVRAKTLQSDKPLDLFFDNAFNVLLKS
ncbi:TetR family transcriptional regulator C-terminal domain-containing protein [Silvibacterium acidisoli]|uniref:TetR family transcriptional regulator C-terminal domain-containing protein n=1 Tax=Acidobacteriaceae bacterium ZG23-2 TaxID=2883246 RepID=UPI00406C3A6F